MVPHAEDSSQILWEDGERVVRRGWRLDDSGKRRAVLMVLPAADHPSRASLDRLAHEYELKDELDTAWAVRPLDLMRDAGRTTLVLEDAGGELLEGLVGAPMELGRFLPLAIGIAVALGKLHRRGLIHKDIKPTNILVNRATDEVRLTGFGIASRLVRERQSPHPPETIAGTLAYMAPEQTGRMNRSIDSRSDLYSLGITFYQMLTGALPFTAAEPMEWVHCHLARRPVAPAERVREIPDVVSAIVMKLLAKWAEDRYQTAAGLESDLRRCQSECKAQRRIDDFPLGEHDTPDRLLIPEKLYGRQREVETLLAAFDRVVNGGAPELVLVSGYSGIGKSSVVNELQPVLVPPRALFASGKFDQYKRDIPYSTLAQAFQSLVRPLLAKSDVELGDWRKALREALGPNGQLMVDLVPELRLIIGEQSAVPELPPQDAQRRFQLVFRRFLAAFARPEHPLALFLDDLQWLDAATLDLLEDLLIHPDVRHVLLIGAYRDNEVTAAHPLMRKLETIRATGRVQDIKLGPLTIEDLQGLISDALHCDEEQSAPLAELVHSKTDGNPFFVIQFLYALADEGLVSFDRERARWSFDLGGIHAKRYTDNVVGLLAGKLTRLQRDTQDALEHLACLGNVADVATLAIVLQMSEENVHAALSEALHQQLIERLDRSYRFVHDRVQEAGYALIPETSRAEAHLSIGRLLVAQTPPEERDESIFEIVNQLNRGAPLITSPQEREQLAELNLAAGKRAKASSAYASALTYLAAGAALLPEDAWERRQDLTFELELHPADCEVCTGALEAAEERLSALAKRAVGIVQRCAVGRRRLGLYTMLGAGAQAVAVALECLRHVGIDWAMHPSEEEARHEYESVWPLLGHRAIEDIVDLPLTQDPEALATLDMLVGLCLPAEYVDENLVALSICRAVKLSLEHGNNDAAAVSYAAMGMIASPRFGDHEKGYRIGKVACDLVEHRGLTHAGGRVYGRFALVVPWIRPLAEAIEPARCAFEMAKRGGEPTAASFASSDLVSVLLALGHPLDQVEHEAEQGLEFVLPFGSFLDRISAPLALIRMLRGRTAKFGWLDNERFTERSFEERATGEPARAFLECNYWVRKLQARFFAGDFAAAVNAVDKIDWWYATSPPLSLVLLAKTEYHFYAALTRAASCQSTGSDAYERHEEALETHQRELRACAANCPQNYEARSALVGAEIARIEGRPLDAMDLYERAIASARANGFVPDEAIACEVAARFYAARDFKMIANAYLGEARACYLRWGADGKVRQLDQLHPWLRQNERSPGPMGTIETPVEQLDLATVIDVSQALSGEIVLEKLIDRVMRAAIEHAGAERGLLIGFQGEELQIDAEAIAREDNVIVQLGKGTQTAAALPESLVRYAVRTRESVVLDDAASLNLFSADPYIVESRARSILCLPLINQGKLVGVLYLENKLTPHVFTLARVTVLKVLASQAAISLENTRLYRDLADREGRIRRLVDGNIMGVCIWNLAGAIVDANEAFLRMLQYGREDVLSGRLRWTDLTPAEWREQDDRAIEELRSTGTFQPVEKEYFRKDGSRMPVLIGGALFEEGGNEGVAFLVDLTERKRAELLLAMEKRSLEIISSGASLEEILNYLCNSIDALASGPISTVLMMDPEGHQLWHVAGPRVPRSWLPAIMPRPVGPREGCCGTAAYRKERVIVSDVLTDPVWPDEHRGFAMENGIRAAWSEPLLTKDGEVLGTFALYSAEPGTPTAAEIELIESASHIALIAMAQQRSQAALRKSQEALTEVQAELAHANRIATMGQLTASIAHEVTQPIASARNNARAALNFLGMQPPEFGEVREALGCVVADADRAGDIIGRIRDHIKKAPLRKDEFDLNAALNEVIGLARSTINRNGVSVQTYLADGLSPVHGDRVQLQQVILNLILNAVEAMGSIESGARELLVSTKQDRTAVFVTVRDTGPGVDPTDLERIFEAFYTTKSSGVGMGLSICRSIISAHGGRLWAETNEQRGAVFQFTLPGTEGGVTGPVPTSGRTREPCQDT